jgi:hypothetical protein
MNGRTQDRFFAICGIASVVLLHVGLFTATASGGAFVTLDSSPVKVADALAKPAGAGVWIGAYLEVLSVGAFLAFAVWATAKLGGGLLGAVARSIGTCYAAITLASLCVWGAAEFRAGHGMGTQLAAVLSNLNEALYVGTWFLAAFFLLAAAPLALTAGRRALGWSATIIALLTLVGAAVPTSDSAAEIPGLLWFVWIAWASIALARGDRVGAGAVAVA